MRTLHFLPVECESHLLSLIAPAKTEYALQWLLILRRIEQREVPSVGERTSTKTAPSGVFFEAQNHFLEPYQTGPFFPTSGGGGGTAQRGGMLSADQSARKAYIGEHSPKEIYVFIPL